MDVRLTNELAGDFLSLASAGIVREYPNKPQNVQSSASDAKTPRTLHPIFFGCFDWHSAVHAHWTLARLTRLFPEHDQATVARQLLTNQLTADKVRAETDYFQPRENRGFERMYGWAWLLRLAAELHEHPDSQIRQLAEVLQPLTATIVQLTRDYLPRLHFPIRTGIHPDTGFALALMLDFARLTGWQEFADALSAAAMRYFHEDVCYPFAFEPSGEDFFSSGLNEADLMRRILRPEEFTEWFDAFWPAGAENILTPVRIDHPDDGRLGHLAGLNLSRAWTLRGISAALPANCARRSRLLELSERHAAELRASVFNGHYEGEHWLGTFAVYYLSDAGLAFDFATDG